ncbi:hypothetical protein ACOMHN_055552 [Nucella lapillus]
MPEPRKKRRVLIVGAGSSGLTAIKACLEDDLQPVCLEKTLDVGGLWNYRPQPSAPGTAGIYHSLVINTCKEMTAFSDFPVPTRFPQFLSHAHVLAYFRMYAQHFRLLPHVRFNAEVRGIRQAEDYDISGRWTVTYVQHVKNTCPMKCGGLDSCPDEKCRKGSGRDSQREGNLEAKTNNSSSMNDLGTWKNRDKVNEQGAVNGSKPNGNDNTLEESNETNQEAANGLKPNCTETIPEQNPEQKRGKDQHAPLNNRPITNNKEITTDNNKEITIDNNKETSKKDQPKANGESEKTNPSKERDLNNKKPNKERDLNETNKEHSINKANKGHNLDKTNKSETRYCCDREHTNTTAAVPPKPEKAYAAARPKEQEQEQEEAEPQEERINGGACREVTEDFDGVMICTGHHTVPYMPEFPGQADFQGQILHSQDYKRPEPFLGRRVLIVGIGNSAVDIAVDLAKTAQQVYMSTRRGCWVLSRSAGWGVPADMLANSRLMSSLPSWLLQWLVEKQANHRMDHHRLGLTPRHRLLGAHPTINEELPFHLMTRRVEVGADVSRILPRGVRLTDGSVQEVDVIIMATGYDYRLGFVDPKVLKVNDNRVKLYKYVFPPRLPHATLAVIGLVQAIGAVMPIAELQSRWFVSLMTGRVHLPERTKMEKDIVEKEKEMQSRYYPSRRHTLQTFWVQYMDEMAEEIGARPCLWPMVWTQPLLAMQCYLGPCLPAQYRLCGPHPWPHAANFIRNAASSSHEVITDHDVSNPGRSSPHCDVSNPGRSFPRYDVTNPGKSSPRCDVSNPGRSFPRYDVSNPGRSSPRYDVSNPGRSFPRYDVSNPGRSFQDHDVSSAGSSFPSCFSSSFPDERREGGGGGGGCGVCVERVQGDGV